jgi:hypothetical protein
MDDLPWINRPIIPNLRDQSPASLFANTALSSVTNSSPVLLLMLGEYFAACWIVSGSRID